MTPAPRSESVQYRRRRIDPERVVNETGMLIEGMASGLALVDVEAIPDESREEWAHRLGEALRPVQAFQRQITAREARGVAPRPCARCGETFVPTRQDARYCSGRCRVAGHRARASGAAKPSPERLPARASAAPPPTSEPSAAAARIDSRAIAPPTQEISMTSHRLWLAAPAAA